MCGLIWFVQVVHYYLFNKIGIDSFAEYEKIHCRVTGYVVLPPMVLELLTSIYLAFYAVNSLTLLRVNLLLLILIWFSTFLIQTPLHFKLLNGFENVSYLRLVRYNWIRTVLWTLRSLILLVIIYEAI